ncbi:MAG TPA: alpha/beta fold hydrolase [Candidatus Binatia bacterium]|jgi:4,5:9,10-diseco-3-hydroxy-5,9,17-trioxoandrosta-1(10),2-diene-4-oate hydrolase|nr:alpha/beta fold hydrolase [Candidatus Binatia bacterium]
MLEANTRRAALGATAPCQHRLVDGVTLAYDDRGTGPAVVCLHAIGHGASDFRSLGDALAAHRRVIAVDWPDHGNSSSDHQPASAARYEALLARLLDALALDDVVLVGNSIGGAAALRYAASHPDRVRGLVLVNPGGLDPGDGVAPIAIAAMVRFFAAGASGARWFPAAFAAYYRMVLPARAAAAQRARIVAAGTESARVLADAWRSFGEPSADLRALVPQVRCPVLVAWAVRDRLNQLRRCRPAIGRFANGRLETFAAGHAPQLETPEAFTASLTRFLAELPAW